MRVDGNGSEHPCELKEMCALPVRAGLPRRVCVCACRALKKTCMFRMGCAMRVHVRMMRGRACVRASVCERVRAVNAKTKPIGLGRHPI